MTTSKEEEEEECNVNVNVRRLDGRGASISVAAHSTVSHLKTMLISNGFLNSSLHCCHLYLRGSKLSDTCKIRTLELQGDEFIVIVPFARNNCYQIQDGLIGCQSVEDKIVTEKDSKNTKYRTGLSTEKLSGNLIEAAANNSVSPQNVADAMWQDIFSDFSELSASGKFSDEQGHSKSFDYSLVKLSKYSKRDENGTAKSYFPADKDKLHMNVCDRKRKKSERAGLHTESSGDETKFRSSSKSQSSNLFYPPVLQRMVKIFNKLNTVSGFLQQQHIQVTWSNVKEALKQLCCDTFEEVTADEIKKLAALCPKILSLKHGETDDNDSFSIDFSDSPRLDMYGNVGPNKISKRTITNFITKRQKAFEAEVQKIIKELQTRQKITGELGTVTLEDLILVAINMDHKFSRDQQNSSSSCSSRSFLCLDTKNLTPSEIIDHLRAGFGSKGQIVHLENINARKAKYNSIPFTFSDTTNASLKRLGISKLYSHQGEAIQTILSGKHVVIATSTASGKSLCYNIPVLEELSNQPHSCALYLFPTKALAQDQLRALLAMTRELDFNIPMGVYDGDTPVTQRMWLRDNARLLITNPDMLHVSILPSHTRFERILSNIRFVILDEAHAYKGAFGCHTALIMRRLCRICSHLYGRNPTFVVSSATIANPREHAMELANLNDADVVLEDGSPAGAKAFILWNPPLKNIQAQKSRRQKVQYSDFCDTNTKRSSPILEASYVFAELVQHGLRSIAFCNTRKLSELVLSYTQEILRESAPHLIHSICVYRAGYTAQERRKIERDLFAGNLRGVAATNALELGIDVGNLDATLHLGFPGSVSSLWQQAGRAGRREKSSLAVYIAFDGPLDQHFMKYPQKLFSRPIEHSHIDATNIKVVKQHVTCAASEVPVNFKHDEKYFGSVLHGALSDLAKEGCVGRHPDESLDNECWYYIGKEKHPSSIISIRAVDPEKYTIINEATDVIIEEIEESKAFFEVYDGAVYMHQGKTYLVTSLDLSSKIALCQPADLKYYTKTRDFTDVYVTGGDLVYAGKFDGSKNAKTTAQMNFCKVTTKWIGFRKIWRSSNQVFDTVDLFLPEYTYDSQAVWIRVPSHVKTALVENDLPLRAGLHAACHALLNVLPLYVPCNPSDLRSECANPHDNRYFPERLLLFDRHPGGIGTVAQVHKTFFEILHAALDLTAACECSGSTGCPSCIQTFSCSEYNEVLHKQAATIILEAVMNAEETHRQSGED